MLFEGYIDESLSVFPILNPRSCSVTKHMCALQSLAPLLLTHDASLVTSFCTVGSWQPPMSTQDSQKLSDSNSNNKRQVGDPDVIITSVIFMHFLIFIIPSSPSLIP